MNAKRVNAAADVICRAMKQGKTLPTGWANALEAVCMLQSPETAEEQRELWQTLEQRTELLRAVQKMARQRGAEAKGRKAYGERLKAENASLREERAADHRTWQHDLKSLREAREEASALRARVAELEAERHVTNEALSAAAEELRTRRDQIAERDAQIVAWLGKKSREYGTSNRENRAKAEAVWRMADKLSRGAVPLRQAEDPHDGPLRQRFELGRDLPEVTP